MWRRTRNAVLVLAAVGAGCVAGCVTETINESGGGVRLFEPPEDLDSMLDSPGTIHGVEIFFEFDPRKDLPETPEGREVRTLVPTMAGETEVFHGVGGHKLSYAFGELEVGGFRYEARDRGQLYIFKRRNGDFRFKYRGQPIIIRQRGTWIPVVRLIQRKERNAAREVVAIEEFVQIGFANIEIASGRKHWIVNGDEFEPSTNRTLEISGVVDFEGR